MQSGLLCFRLFSELSAAGGLRPQQALASAVVGHPEACQAPAAVLACAGALSRLTSPPVGDARVAQTLQHTVIRAADAAMQRDGELSPGRAALTCAVALATARLTASCDAGSGQHALASSTMPPYLHMDGPMLRCVASAVFHPHTGAAVLPCRSLAAALAPGTLPCPPHVADAALARTMQHPAVVEAGTLVRLLCDACVHASTPPLAADSPSSAFAVALLDAACVCAAASSDAYRHVAHVLPPTPSAAAPPAWSPAAQLPFLCVSAFFVGTKDVYCPPAPRVHHGAAGRILDALARVDVGRTHHGAAPPTGYGLLLESAVRSVAMHPQSASALMRGVPSPNELHAAAWTEDVLARCTFLLRALPFVLPVVLAAAQKGSSTATPSKAELMQQLTQVVVPFALVFVAAPSTGTGQQACRAAHIIMRAVLTAIPHADFPDKAAVAEAYARSTLDACLAVPPDVLAPAFDAALRAMPTRHDSADGSGSPHLALLRALATRVQEMHSLAQSSTDAEGARQLRVALFRTLGAMPPRVLNEALPIYDAAVRSLPPHTTVRQEAVDTLCGACASIDVYHKRRCVDWCLRLAASL